MMRLCPLCGQRTEEGRCPDDGTATLVLAQNPDSRLSEGAEINGRYRIGKLIGQGGFGAVYRALSMATGSEIAIKVLGVSLDNDEPELIQRFYAEAQITAALKHPNTIRVFDFGQTDSGALYIAMELLIGQALNELLRERRREGKALTQVETVKIATQTLRSLAEAHAKGLVHRDLKPHNIFLNEVPGDEAVVKVLDFGIAKRLGSNLTGTGQAFGTPSYMSPEQAQNKAIDARSDLYSLSCVLYQCVSGACPFEGDNPLSVLLSHVTDTPAPLVGRALVPLSPEFIAIIHRSLSKNPNDRFASAQEMRAALDNVAPAPLVFSAGSGAPSGELSHPDSLRLDVDRDVGDGDHTAAYQPALSAIETTAERGLALHPPGSRGSLGGGSTGHTEAFLLGGADADRGDLEASTPATAATSKKGAGLLIAAVAVLMIGGAAAVFMTNSGAAGTSTASADATAALQLAPAVDATPSVAPTGDVVVAADIVQAAAEDVAVAVAAVAAVDEAPPSPAVAVAVELVTLPAGAKVRIAGADVGVTPLKVTVEAGSVTRATLTLAGYRDLEIVLEPDQAPTRTVTLTAEAKARPSRPRPTPSRPSRPTRQPSKSPLDERI